MWTDNVNIFSISNKAKIRLLDPLSYPLLYTVVKSGLCRDGNFFLNSGVSGELSESHKPIIVVMHPSELKSEKLWGVTSHC